MAKIMVAMSGGVDSSVAALRLLEAGHEVAGVTLKPVSYTHLDVYKRQLSETKLRRRRVVSDGRADVFVRRHGLGRPDRLLDRQIQT